MARYIKTKQTKEKTIKTLDKSVIYSQRLKDNLIDTKDKFVKKTFAELNINIESLKVD